MNTASCAPRPGLRLVAGALLFIAGCFIGAVPCPAQARSSLAVYVPAPKGGTAEQQEYFQNNFKTALDGAQYWAVDTPEEAAFVLQLDIRDNPGFTDSRNADGDNYRYFLSARLERSGTNEELTSISFPFNETEAMTDWDLRSIYQTIADIALPETDQVEDPPPETPEITGAESLPEADQAGEPPEAAGITLADPLPKVELPEEPPPEFGGGYWLYLGLRAGSSLRMYSRDTADPFVQREVVHYYNFNIALHASAHLLSWFDVQGEVNFTTDYAPFIVQDSYGDLETMSFNSTSITFPVLARFNFRRETAAGSLLAGPYVILPLGKMNNRAMGGDFEYGSNLPLGFTGGFNVGFQCGPGWLSTDIRLAADFGKMVSSGGDELYRRTMLTLNIGYEMGILK